jgi:glycerate kinase
MKIIIAPDAYKESLSAKEVCSAIYRGFIEIFPASEIIGLPLADGGEGTLECLLNANQGTVYFSNITGPLKETLKAPFGILNDNTAVIEIAQAAGLPLVPHHQRNPLKTTSYGCGELIRHALDKGCRQFLIGLGGSATCDGGIGALAALGLQFKDNQGQEIEYTGQGLAKLDHIDISTMDARLVSSEFILAHDVNSPLLGPEGAIQYTPQKGATIAQTDFLQHALENYAQVLSKTSHTLHKNIETVPGTGAAGGLAAGLFAFLNAKLEPGAPLLIKTLNLRKNLQDAQLVITGEGQIDSQTLQGKTPIAVAKLAKEFNLPVIAIAGRLGKGYYKVYEQGIDAVFSIANGPMSETFCMDHAKTLLTSTATNIARLLNAYQ